MDGMFFFDSDRLMKIADHFSESYRVAQPFPHVVIDDFVPDEVLQEVVREIPEPGDRDDWQRAERTDTIKLSMPRDWALGPVTRQLLNQFNSAAAINFLERLTGINDLIPDPHYWGGGLHVIDRDGFLKIHADFNRHPRFDLDRRINALLYLNPDWRDEWGGHLELWDRTMTQRVQKIAPTFNRLVVFSTTDTSYHGHPDPLESPIGTRRHALALYYYSNGRPEEEKSPAHGTLYQARSGDDFDPKTTLPMRPLRWRDFVPPVASRWRRSIREHWHAVVKTR
jgi:Rps23 Pro-64 3,4-dihydroxylase Tpa1-like proline 4-hydroxylase